MGFSEETFDSIQAILNDECALSKDEARRIALYALDELRPREAKVLSMRFGFDDGETKTLEHIGWEFNVTRESIRQIQESAFNRLRNYGTEYTLFRAAYYYGTLYGRYLKRYENAIECSSCGKRFMPTEESHVCPRCDLRAQCIEKINAEDFTVEEEYPHSFVLKHVCGREIEYRIDSSKAPECEFCRKTSKARSLIDFGEFTIESEEEKFYMLRHHVCGEDFSFPYRATEPPECHWCSSERRRKEEKKFASSLINKDEFEIVQEEYNQFVLKHKCGNKVEYPYKSQMPPVCHACKRPDLRNLILSAGFGIEGEYSDGFYIRHWCGYRRKYRFDNTDAPVCQGCVQRAKKRSKDLPQGQHFDLTLLENIDEQMEEKLKKAGIDNTRTFLNHTARQIYRMFVDQKIGVDEEDILIFEAARHGVSVSGLGQPVKTQLLEFAKTYKNKSEQAAAKAEEIGKLIIGLPNIGQDRANKLESIGFINASDLVESAKSTESIWKELYSIYPAVDLQDIYAIEGARQMLKMKDLPRERKRELREFVESIKGPW